MKHYGGLGCALLGVVVLLSGPTRAAEPPKQPTLGARAAYAGLLALFPEAKQGHGIDTFKAFVGDQPMTYGFVLSAEAIRTRAAPDDEARRRVRKAARWLLDNRDLDGDGLPGWGLPQAWDAWADGSTNPKNHPYTITSAICLAGLLDALAVPNLWTDAERTEILDVVAKVAVRWCRHVWTDGFGGGYFWYSPSKADEIFGINASSMFLAALATLLHDHGAALKPDDRRLVQDRADRLATAIAASAKLGDGVPYWDYRVTRCDPKARGCGNDLVHHVYTLWGPEVYRDCGGSVKLPWTRAQAVESVERFWKDGRITRYPQPHSTRKAAKPKTPLTRLWSVGMMLAFYGKWGTEEQGARCLEAIARDYGPWPRLRFRPASGKTFYPRHAAHVLYGLALHGFRPRP